MLYLFLASAAFIFLAWKRLDLAVLLIIAGTPLYLWRGDLISLPLTFLEIMILTGFAIWLLKGGPDFKTLFKKDKQRTAYPFRWEIIAVLLVSFGGLMVAEISPAALGIWKAYFFEPLLLFVLIINLFSYPAGRKKIIGALAISALAISLFAIFQQVSGLFIDNPFWQAAATRRATSFFPYPNAVGLFLGPLILIFLGQLINYWSSRSWAWKIFYLSTILFSLAAIVAARSEGALVGLIAGLGIFALLINKKIRLIAIVSGILLTLTLWFAPPLKEFTLNKVLLKDLSGQIRRQQWQETSAMLKDGRLITGAGISAYQEAVAPYHQDGIWIKTDDPDWLRNIMFTPGYREKMWQPTEIYLYPHNIVLNFWSELGILGALLFLWIIAKAMAMAEKVSRDKNDSERHLALGLLGALIVLTVHGLVDVPYFKNDLAALFWIYLALIGGLNLKSNEKNLTKSNR